MSVEVGGPTTAPAHLFIDAERVERVPAGPVAVFELHGSTDTYTLDRFDARIGTALNHGAWSVVVDLAGVPFLDAEGIGTLLRAQRLIHYASAGTLLLVAVPEQGRKTLRMKGLDTLLACLPTVGDAMAFLDAWTVVPRV